MACYVPFCESAFPTKKGEKREEGVSFHHFPTDVELRKKWIIAIGRKDPKTGAYWDPYSSAVVCSLHFSPKQFRTTKKCFLKHGSIPFIFPDYYLPERGALIKETDLSSIKLIPFPNNVNSENSSEQGISSQSSNADEISSTSDIVSSTKKKKKKRTFSEMNPSATDDCENVDKQPNSGKPKFRFRIISVSKIPKLALSQSQSNVNFTHEAPVVVDLTSEDSSSSPEASLDSSLETNSKTTGAGIPHTNSSHAEIVVQNTAKDLTETSKSCSSDFNYERKKNQILLDEVLKLQEENKTLKVKNRVMEQKLKAFNIEELNRGVMRSNARALFIYDQLNSFAEGKGTLSKSTINFAKNLEKKFPECYNFLREADIMALPFPTSL